MAAVTDLLFIHSNNLTTPAQLGGVSGTATFTTATPDFNARVNGATADGGTVTMGIDFDLAQITAITPAPLSVLIHSKDSWSAAFPSRH